uniref:Uncharacterized protein n=1 Tax=Parascaris equorum TaxID=6256 RepID=A0A914R481_PAREQ
ELREYIDIANYPNFQRLLRGIVHVRAWHIKSIEFLNVDFKMVERAIHIKLEVSLVLLRNCTFTTIMKPSHAYRILMALNRKKHAVVCEYGDDRFLSSFIWYVHSFPYRWLQLLVIGG